MRGRKLSFYIRPMQREDVTAVTFIDREAFPTQWPAPNYQRELQNRLSYHFVACDSEMTVEIPPLRPPPDGAVLRFVSQLLRPLRRPRPDNNAPPPDLHYIVGFVGIWTVSDEAHITAIAVREAYRGKGIGELLMIAAFLLAEQINTHYVTLEVRVSNTVAQNLYTKYGFQKTGIRRGYYLDNREDALIMSTPDIATPEFRQSFEELKQAHLKKMGIPPDLSTIKIAA